MTPAELLMRSVLPNGGYVVTWGAYFDESGTDSNDPYLCMAGYIFKDDAFTALDTKWKAMLDGHKDSDGKSLPYFHMSECNSNVGIFAKFTEPQCIQIATEAIALIKQHMSWGFAVSIDKEFADLIPKAAENYSSPYTFACWMCLMSVRHFVLKHEHPGDVIYTFEEGHDRQGEARLIVDRLLSLPQTKGFYRSAGSGFYNKLKVRPLQCADVLAWHWNKWSGRQKRGITRLRGDFSALMAGQESLYVLHHFGEERIKDLALRTSITVLKHKWRDLWGYAGEHIIHDTIQKVRRQNIIL